MTRHRTNRSFSASLNCRIGQNNRKIRYHGASLGIKLVFGIAFLALLAIIPFAGLIALANELLEAGVGHDAVAVIMAIITVGAVAIYPLYRYSTRPKPFVYLDPKEMTTAQLVIYYERLIDHGATEVRPGSLSFIDETSWWIRHHSDVIETIAARPDIDHVLRSADAQTAERIQKYLNIYRR